MALPEHALESGRVGQQRLRFGHTALRLLQFILRARQFVASGGRFRSVVSANPDRSGARIWFLRQPLDHLQQRCRKHLALRRCQVVGRRQHHDATGTTAELDGHRCSAYRTSDNLRAIGCVEVEQCPIAKPSGQVVEKAANRVLRDRRTDILAVGGTKRGPAERISLRPGNQGVSIQSGERCNVWVTDVWICEDNEHASVVEQLLKLKLALLQQLSQTEMKCARLSYANGASVWCFHIERCRSDSLNLLGNCLRIDDAGVVVKNRRCIGDRVVVDAGAGYRAANGDDSHRLFLRSIGCPRLGHSHEFTPTHRCRRWW